MAPHHPTRRTFLQLTTASLLARAHAQKPSLAHANVADLDHDTILTQAKSALTSPVTTPPNQTFHTETEPILATAGGTPQPKLLRTDADALRVFSQTVATLTAGYLVTHDDAYTQRAATHIKPWLLDPKTRLNPTFDEAGCLANTVFQHPHGRRRSRPPGRARPRPKLPHRHLHPRRLSHPPDLVHRHPALARHQQAGLHRPRIQRPPRFRLAARLLRYRALHPRRQHPRRQLANASASTPSATRSVPDGVFPQEVATPNPYRNTLFNFDLLAGACQILSSQFDLLWDYQLIDEVGLRSVAAYLYPVIAHPERWAYPADATNFRDLPGRRPAMLFAGRAYNRPEYVETWLSTPATPPPAVLAPTYPICQPALWTARAPHGL